MDFTPSAYIPIDRRLALARGETLPTETSGAALMADLSGFTALAETLAQELGPKRGAEELTKQLNRIYGALIDEVHRYRGTVISFSGDAITCWFDQDPGLRATACAVALQQVMLPFAVVKTPSNAQIALAIKVAVAAGAARRFQIGDPSIQHIDTLAGRTFDRLAATEHLAQKGDVVVSPEVVDQVGERLVLREWRTDETEHRGAVITTLAVPVAAQPWPELEQPLTEAVVRPWLLPDIADHIWSGEDNYLAELRPAATLFVRFSGIDYDHDPQAQAKLDAYLRWAQRIVRQQAGALLQLTIGDKGAYFYCAFGAPLAHDDDPARAVAAALELRQLPPELAFITSIQIGLSWGRIWAGPYGGPTRRTYGILGDEVNLAARLMGRAEPGQILVGPKIAAEVRTRYTLEEVGPITVKGKQAPVVVAQVTGQRLASAEQLTSQSRHPLVGRGPELAQLIDSLQRALAGDGQIFRLVGAAGIGKSHLSAAVTERAQAQGARVAIGVCQSITEHMAYAPWRQVFYTLFELPADDLHSPPAAQIKHIEEFIQHTHPAWQIRLPLLGDLLGLPIPDNATTTAFEPRLRQSALFDLAVELLHYWAGQHPLVIVIDDAHWMDEASQGLALALGRTLSSAALLFLLVHRPPLAGTDVLPGLSELAWHQGLMLDELSPAGVTELVEHKLGGRANPLTLSLIQAETQGNPFFVEELLDSLQESGHLSQRPDGEWMLSDTLFAELQRSNSLIRAAEGFWQLAPTVSLSEIDLGLPDSIQGVVLSRIDRLPQQHKLTLKVASVIGRSFALDLLSRAHPLQPNAATLTEHAMSLEAREFTRVDAPLYSYSFKHTVTRDVTYETLLFDQRRQLHRAVGLALEMLAPDAVSQLAYHAFTGEDWERALRHQIAAGQQAQKLFVNHEGIEHFRKALLCAGHLPPEQTVGPRQQIHASLGELLTTTSQYEAALDHLQQALALAAERGDEEAQAKACRWIAYVYEFRSEYALALEWIQRGLTALGQQETAFTAELLAIAGLIHSRQGNYEHALEQCALSVQVAERVNAANASAMAHSSQGVIFVMRGHNAQAIQNFERALSLYEETGNIHGQARALNQIANAFFNLGQWPAAYRHYQRAREIFIQTGDVRWTATISNNLGGMALNQGRLEEALSLYADGLRLLGQIGASAWIIGVFNMNIGAAHIQRHELEKGRQYLFAGQALFAQAQARDYLPELQRHLAEASLLDRNLADAEYQAQQSLALAQELKARSEEGSSLRVLGSIALAQGQVSTAQERLEQSLAILEETGELFEAARTRLALAETFLARKDRGGLPLLEHCTAVFEQLGATLSLTRAQEMQQAFATLAVQN